MMGFPRLSLKIWFIFSLTFIIYSAIQFLSFSYQINEYSDSEYINLLAEAGGSIIWSDNAQESAVASEQMADLYFPEELVEEILTSHTLLDPGEHSFEWSGEDEEFLYSLKIGRRDGLKTFNLIFTRNDLIPYSSLIFDGLRSTFIAFLIMLVPAYLISLNLVKPLLKLEGHAMEISSHNLSLPIKIRRRDEIGKLAESLEKMRVQLKSQDESRQLFFQAVSHELKTPISVIRSHIQAVADNIGSREDNLAVIDNESVRLNEKVGKLLSIAKLDYLSSRISNTSSFGIMSLIEEIYPLMDSPGRSLRWKLSGSDYEIESSRELLTSLLENILDNQIRYASEEIEIDLSLKAGRIDMEISNDGPPVRDDELESIFLLFRKSSDGGNGMGLYIVREIAGILGGSVSAENREGRTHFLISLPLSHNFT